MRCIIPNKIRFINELNNVIPKYNTNVESIRYRVFKHVEKKYYEEILEINYTSGARSTRTCNGNSFIMILEELTQYLGSGYYLENNRTIELEQSPEWKELSLEEIETEYK